MPSLLTAGEPMFCPSSTASSWLLSIGTWLVDCTPCVCITSVDHKGVTCYGLRGRGVESRSLMTSVETRDLSGKANRSRVNINTKRVGKSRHWHVDGGMFTTVAILNEKSFRSLIEARSLQLHVCRFQWSSVWWWVVRGTQGL